MERIPELYKYKHISFDLWLTLIKSNPEFKSKRNLLFREFFEITRPIDEVAAVIRKFDVLTNSINEKAGKNFDTFEIYYLILDALGIDIEKYSKENLNQFYTRTEELLMEHKPLLLSDDIPVFLKSLQDKGMTMNILSNTAFIKGKSLRKIIDYYGLGDCFAFQLFSDETGFSKPSEEMYRLAYQSIREIGEISKTEVLHIGDNKVSDFEGAKKFGFGAYLIINNHINDLNLQPA